MKTGIDKIKKLRSKYKSADKEVLFQRLDDKMSVRRSASLGNFEQAVIAEDVKKDATDEVEVLMSITKKKSDRYLLVFVSYLYQIGGWWLLLAYDDAGVLAFGLFLVALALGLYAMHLRKKEGASS